MTCNDRSSDEHRRIRARIASSSCLHPGRGDAARDDLDRFQTLQWQYEKKPVNTPRASWVKLGDAATYSWPERPCRDLGRRRDNDFKRSELT
jgi:hypothetical protein